MKAPCLRTISSLLACLFAVMFSACGDVTDPRSAVPASRRAGVPIPCANATLGLIGADVPMAIGTTSSCEPYDCAEGWFGHVECDPYDCTLYPTTCIGGGGGSTGPGGGGSGNDSSSTVTGVLDLDCPTTNPRCLVQLSAAQRQRMINALNLAWQSIGICKAAYDAVMAIQSSWWGGDTDLIDNPTKPGDQHDAQSRVGANPILHVDLDYLDSFRDVTDLRGLGRLLLHEGWHLAGYPNHLGESGPQYTTEPYDKANLCIP